MTALNTFDGKSLYEAALAAVRDYHLMLNDRRVREAWLKVWQTRFDSSDRLATEAGCDSAVREMLLSLQQRFDSYMGPQAAQADRQSMDATKVGIGVSAVLTDALALIDAMPDESSEQLLRDALKISETHPLVITRVTAGSPAETAGVLPGDEVVSLGGTSIEGMPMHAAIALLTSCEGNPVVLVLRRRASGVGEPALVELTAVPHRRPDPVVTRSELAGGVAYIRISSLMSQFVENETLEALKACQKSGGLVLDLRSNTGGRLEAAITILGYLLPEGTILVTDSRRDDLALEASVTVSRRFFHTVRQDPQEPQQFNCTDSPRHPFMLWHGMPLVVLVNEYTASAAEIVAGALQANHRALVVGSRTVGKGVGQRVVDLPFGRRINVTHFATYPGGQELDAVGVLPDMVSLIGAKSTRDTQLKAALVALTRVTRRSKRRHSARLNAKKRHVERFVQLTSGLNSAIQTDPASENARNT